MLNPTEEDREQESDGEDINFTLSKGMHFVIVICAILPAIFSTFSAAVTILQPIPFSIYLAQIITQARYINQSHFGYILLE